jgi:glycosyltransferase involved in cell wall biosynthesis
VFKLLRSARYVVVPSTCYETFGLVAIEAFSCGVAVIASNHGALGELIDDGVTGLLVKPGDAVDLAEKITWANGHPVEMLAMGRRAYARYLKSYTAQENYKLLMDIYGIAISSTRKETNGNQAVVSIRSKDKCIDVG